LISSLDGLDHSHGKKEGKKGRGDLLLDDISIQSSAAIKRIIETANQMVQIFDHTKTIDEKETFAAIINQGSSCSNSLLFNSYFHFQEGVIVVTNTATEL